MTDSQHCFVPKVHVKNLRTRVKASRCWVSTCSSTLNTTSSINNYSPKRRWPGVDICRAEKREDKYSPPAIDTEVNSWFLINSFHILNTIIYLGKLIIFREPKSSKVQSMAIYCGAIVKPYWQDVDCQSTTMLGRSRNGRVAFLNICTIPWVQTVLTSTLFLGICGLFKAIILAR